MYKGQVHGLHGYHMLFSTHLVDVPSYGQEPEEHIAPEVHFQVLPLNILPRLAFDSEYFLE